MPTYDIDNPFRYGAVELSKTAAKVRKNIIMMNSRAGAGHTGADLSQADILVTLYFSVMRYDMEQENPHRDRFILSKGHGAGGFYCTLAEAGFFSRDILSSYLKFDSILPGHPVKQKLKPVEVNTGALGHGLPVAVGLALAAKKSGRDYNVFVLTGDGELQEGSNWEAMMSASTFELDNLILIIDRNRLQLADRTEKIMRIEPLEDKLRSFGFRVDSVDGNDPAGLLSCFQRNGGRQKPGAPLAVVAHTLKGKGVSFIEDNAAWHHRIPEGDEIHRAIEELE